VVAAIGDAGLRVLLISPIPALDPPNGDVTYTRQLLDCPPPGVGYTTYDQALADASLIERYRRRPGDTRRSAFRREPDRLGFAREHVINRLLRGSLLFREPFRFFRVDSRAYDLVHCHIFNARFEGLDIPLVTSNSLPLHALYRDGFGVSRGRVEVMRAGDAWLARRLSVTHTSYGNASADAVICFSEHLRTWFLTGGDDPARFVVVPPSVEPLQSCDSSGPEYTVGFVGDYAIKGGALVVEAQRILRRRGVASRIVMVSDVPESVRAEAATLGIEVLPRLPRAELLGRILPLFSVLAYPTRCDGLPLTLLEAMAAGVPPIVSEYRALPSVVLHGQAGMTIPRDNAIALADALEAYAEPSLRARHGRRAREHVASTFSPRVTSEALRRAYDLAQTRFRASSGSPSVAARRALGV
jgi:glycosyltransferase involved in cell wall biosynthesis